MRDLSSISSLPQMFLDRADHLADLPFLYSRQGGKWLSLSWTEVKEQSLALAASIMAAGIQPGERVLLVSENRPEWSIIDLAIQMAGAICVPAYVTNTVDAHRHVITDSGARMAFVSSKKLADPLIEACNKTDLNHLVSIEPLMSDSSGDLQIDSFANFIQQDADQRAVQEQISGQKRDHISAIIYTSGTSGTPVGVIHSHGNILHNCYGIMEVILEMNHGKWEQERFLSFLPLSHSYERSAGQYGAMATGAQIFYAERIDTLLRDMAEIRPTFVTAVPRLYESMRSRILAGIQRKGGISKALFMQTINLGKKKLSENKGLSLFERLLNAVLERVVRRKVRARFGGTLKAFVSGGAPMEKEVGLFLSALGLKVLQGYGLTESAPVASVNRPYNNRLGTVGLPLPGVRAKLAQDGELLLKGELVTPGYWEKPKKTAETIRDGWLYTGDIATIDDDGFISIIDRKKDMIVNSGGDNIAPQRVENILCLQPEIAQALVYGDKRPHLVGLIVADADFAEDKKDVDIEAGIAKAVERANISLAVFERIRRFIVADEAFTIENGLLTPSLKTRKHEILAIYSDKLEQLYNKEKAKV